MTGFALIVPALRDAVLQLGDRRILGVLGLSLGLMLVLTGPFVAVFLALAAILEWLLPARLDLPWLGEVGFPGVFTQGLTGRTAWVFWTYVMSPLAAAIVGALLDPIVAAVERRHYPGLAPVRPRGLVEQVLYAVRFFALMLSVSLGALVVSLLTPLPAVLVFALANGYLIAREYFETVALRRLTEADAAARERAVLPVLWTLGTILALGLMVPYLNLVVPLIGVAAFTHLFQGLGASS